ncbi:MAG: tRNA glutamyl-Q(34) synthetase GluQRS [Acidobacteriota bacterium]
MPAPAYIGRLAPSPTGLLHLGHARTFFIAWERAQAANGTLWLRDEDLDPQRSKPEFSTAMREDLHWLGIDWQQELTQSTRLEAYKQALQQLLAKGLIYPCTCSRKDLAQSTQAPHDDDDEPLYNNRCRPSSPAPSTTIQPNTNYRFRVPTTEAVAFLDANAGPQTFTPGLEFSDFLVWRKDGLPSYQLACAVDDAYMQITEVVRGRDLLKSTARQILLQRALSLPTPHYFHTDLMRDEQGVRLAKRHDALSLRSLREQGLTPAAVRRLWTTPTSH